MTNLAYVCSKLELFCVDFYLCISNLILKSFVFIATDTILKTTKRLVHEPGNNRYGVFQSSA